MAKFDRFVAIDCGRGGAIAHISSGRPPITVSMPDNVDEIKSYFDYLKEISTSPIACIEKVGLWRTDANQGKAFGIEKMTRSLNEITTILRIVKIPFIQIFPIQWQAYLNIRSTKHEEYSDRKRRFKEIAQKNFPQIKVTLTNADALLIMQFIGLKWQREPEWILKKLPKSIVKTLEL
jgi:hypothetical protein